MVSSVDQADESHELVQVCAIDQLAHVEDSLNGGTIHDKSHEKQLASKS